MASPLPLTERFERNGLWWRPEIPDQKVVGALEFDPTFGATLSLVGVFGRPFDAVARAIRIGIGLEYQTLHGMTVDGKAITLARAVQSGANLNAPGLTTERYVAAWLFIGAHLQSEVEGFCFRSEADFENLAPWLGQRLFETKYTDDPHTLAMTCAPPEDQVLGHLPALDADVVVSTVVNVRGGRSDRFEAIAQTGIGVTSKTRRSAKWHFDQIVRINKLAAVCNGRVLPLRSITLFADDEQLDEETFVPRRVEVLLASMPGAESKPGSNNPIYTARELIEDNPDAFARWFEISDEMGPVIDLLFTVIANPRPYLEVGFLLAIQAVEVFHRRTSHDGLTDAKAFEELIGKVKAAIPLSVSRDLRQKIEGMLNFANEPSLSQRLTRTVRALEPTYGKSVLGFTPKLIKAIVDTRNYHTHYSAHLKGSAIRGPALRQLTDRIVPLLFVLLLQRLGLPADKVKAQIMRRQEFANFMQQAA